MQKTEKHWLSNTLRYRLILAVILFVSPATVFMAYSLTATTNAAAILVVATFFTFVYIWCFFSLLKHFKEAHSQRHEAAIQTEALNQHSMVTKTDLNSVVTYVNENFLRSTGYSSNDLMGKESLVYWPKQEEALLHEICTTLKRGKKWCGNVPLKTKCGKTIHTHSTYVPQMDAKGALVGSIAIRTDISDTKVATGDKNTRRALHILRDEIYMFEAGTLYFTYLNQAAMDATGWNESKYPQMTFFDRFMSNEDDSAMDIKKFYQCVRPLVNDELKEITQELMLNSRPSEIKIQLVRPDVGRPYFMTIVRDISERVEFDKAKDEFISTVSHELRTPLTSIKGALGLTLSGKFGEFNESGQKILDIAYRNSERLGLLINDILDLEKMAAGRMNFHLEPVNMAELIQNAIVENKPYSDQYHVSMKGVGLEESVMGLCDHDRIFQVMNNLLSNAAKFSHKGDQIFVELQERKDTVCVSVEDFGMGIPNKAKATIFERFSQADSSDRRKKGGSGLGLSIVKQLVEKQNGTIDFTSIEGEGTKFFFEIPKPDSGAQEQPHENVPFAAE